MLQIILASDGDLHLSVVEDPDHEDAIHKCNYVSGSIRLRMPLVGGGSYEHLYTAIKKAMFKELAVEEKRYPGSIQPPNVEAQQPSRSAGAPLLGDS